MTGSDVPQHTVAVVLAGGTGERLGLQVPKQLLEIGGRSIIGHSIQAFEAAAEIDEIIVLMTPGFTDRAEAIVSAAGHQKVSRVLEGGETRTESTRIAIAAAGERLHDRGEPESGCKVLFHDAVRPFVDERIITDCVQALDSYDAVAVAIPSSDTIMVVEGGVISHIPDRTTLRRVQTPQGFRLPVIRTAYERAMADPGFSSTDDCGVVLRYLPEVPITVVTGSEYNMKITHPIDVALAGQLSDLATQQATAEAGGAGATPVTRDSRSAQ